MRRHDGAARSACVGWLVACAVALGTLGAGAAVVLDRPATPAPKPVTAADLASIFPGAASAHVAADGLPTLAHTEASDVSLPRQHAPSRAGVRPSDMAPALVVEPAPPSEVPLRLAGALGAGVRDEPPADRTATAAARVALTTTAPPACATCAVSAGQDQPQVPVVPSWAVLPLSPLRRGIVVHTVQEGDRLFDLAERYGVSVDTLRWSNEIANPDHLVPGQKLRVLPVSGVLHRLGPDETLVHVARRYGADLAAIIAVNDFPNPDQVPAGTEVIVPGARPQPATVPPVGERREPMTYSVAEGDTLRSIAERFGISVATILRSNTLADPDNVPVGTRLTILPQSGLLHTVRPDETLKSLAAHYGVSVQEIVAANDLASGDVLPVGQRLLIPERPGWNSAAPAAAAPPPAPAQPGSATHRIAEGDTLSTIAARYGVSLADLRAMNGLEASDVIYVGQELRLPGDGRPLATASSTRPVEHVVQPGEMLSTIAARYGVSPDALLRLNELSDPNLLGIGQRLRLPGGAPPASGPAPRPAAAPKTERYVVQAGDSVVRLAEQRGTSPETIIRLNGLREPYMLFVGQELTVPVAPVAPQPAPPTPVPIVRYTVQPGDTLGAIAQRHGVAPLAIAQANGLEPPYVLAIGRELAIPGGKQPASAAAPGPSPSAAAAPAPRPAAQPTATPAAQPQPAPATSAPQPQAAAAPAGDLLAIARQQLGTRYVWGGSSPQTGFDCSGFVMWVFRQAGRYMPRDIWGQVQSGPRIARDQLRPGDLVFFQNTYTTGLSHNGIYLGNGQFIHAASERVGVIVSRLDEPYWAARWYAAVRPAK